MEKKKKKKALAAQKAPVVKAKGNGNRNMMLTVSPCQQDCTIFAVDYINGLSDNAPNKQDKIKHPTLATD